MQLGAAPRERAPLQSVARRWSRRVSSARSRARIARGCSDERRRSARRRASRRRAIELRARAHEAREPVVERLLVRRDREPRIAEPAGDAPVRDALVRDAGCASRARGAARAPEQLALRLPVGHDHLRGLRRRRRARVGGEVDERHVDVVAHGAHDRDAARGDGAHDGLLVERAEVVRGAAAAPEDDDVHVADALQLRERAADRLDGARALHLRGREQDPRAAAAKRDAADVVDDRARRARDDADDARLAGQRALALRREQPLGGELRLQPLERLEQRAAPGRPAGDRR